MRMESLVDYRAGDAAVAGYDFGKSYRLRRETSETEKDEALQRVEDARSANTHTTLDMMDRHNEMVRKSQELFKIKQKKLAIERRNQERREEQTDLLAQMAIENAERSDLFDVYRLRA